MRKTYSLIALLYMLSIAIPSYSQEGYILYSIGNGHSPMLKYGNKLYHSGMEQLTIETNWKSIATDFYASSPDVGFGSMYGIKMDGTLWEWCNTVVNINSYDKPFYRYYPVKIGYDSDWESICLGENILFGIKKDGSLWVIKGNTKTAIFGLGIEKDTNSYSSSDLEIERLTRVGNDNNWSKMICKEGSIIALKKDGSLWVWGINDLGVLGLGHSKEVSSPTKVNEERDWVDFDFDGKSVVAVKKDSTLRVWGFSGRQNNEISEPKYPKYYYTPTKIKDSTSKWLKAVIYDGEVYAIHKSMNYNSSKVHFDLQGSNFLPKRSLQDSIVDIISGENILFMKLIDGRVIVKRSNENDFSLYLFEEFVESINGVSPNTNPKKYIYDDNFTILTNLYKVDFQVVQTKYLNYLLKENTLPSTKNRISGKVKDSNGKPVESATLILSNTEYENTSELRTIKKTTTNKDGLFEFDNTAIFSKYKFKLEILDDLMYPLDYSLDSSNYFNEFVFEGDITEKFVKGKVIDVNGVSINGVKISLIKDNKVIVETNSDKDGNFTIKCQNGNYLLTIDNNSNKFIPSFFNLTVLNEDKVVVFAKIDDNSNSMKQKEVVIHAYPIDNNPIFPKLFLEQFDKTFNRINWKNVSIGNFITGVNDKGELVSSNSYYNFKNDSLFGVITDFEEQKRWLKAGNHFAITEQGELWAIYSNINSYKENKRFPFKFSDINDWVDVKSAWEGPIVAKRSDGSVWAWSVYNYIYKLLEDEIPIDVPIKIGEDAIWRKFSIANNGSIYSDNVFLGIKDDGSLWSLSIKDNFYKDNYFEIQEPVRIGNDNDWEEIAFGSNIYFGIKKDGSLWAWGICYNSNLGFETDENEYNEPVRVGSDNDWLLVSTENNSTLLIKKDGTLWAIGDHFDFNYTNELKEVVYKTPTKVNDENDWIYAEVKDYFALLIKSNYSNSGGSGIANPKGDYNVVSLYPNPSNSEPILRIELKNEISNYEISIYDSNGNFVKNIALNNLSKGVNLIKINVSNLPKGVYFIKGADTPASSFIKEN